MKNILQRKISKLSTCIGIDIKKAVKHSNNGNIEGFIRYSKSVEILHMEKKIYENLLINI